MTAARIQVLRLGLAWVCTLSRMEPCPQNCTTALSLWERNRSAPRVASGIPFGYDETFEALQAQMDRMGSLTGEIVEWPTVVHLATEILQNKSKDLLVLTYLTVGLFENNGYAGLAAGISGYCAFIENFWEGCFPKVKPPHGRLNAIQYLADKILPDVELKGGKAERPSHRRREGCRSRVCRHCREAR